MTDTEVLELRNEYENLKMTIPQFAEHKGLDEEKVRYALRKALKLRREASGEISFTTIKTDHLPLSDKTASVKFILITTSNGTTIHIPS